MRQWNPLIWTIMSSLLLPLLAGCSGQGGGPDEAPHATPDAQGARRLETVDLQGDVPIQMVDGVALHVNETLEGSFQMYEACPVFCSVPADAGVASAHRVHDITDLLPMGVAAQVKVALFHNAEDGPTPVHMGGHSLILRTPDQTYGSAFRLTGASATDEVFAKVVRRSPGAVEVVVEYYGPEPDQATFDYRVEVQVQVDPRSVHAGVPVALELSGGGDGLALRSAGEGDSTFSFFAPDGSRLGPYTVGPVAGQLVLPDGSPAGTYLLVVHKSREGVQLYTSGDQDTRAQILDIRLETGETVALDDEGTAAWSFDVGAVPVRVGFWLTSGQASWIEGTTSLTSTEQGRASITGPAGAVLDTPVDMAFNCVLCPEPTVFGFHSRAGHEALLPGTYDATFEATTGPGGSVQAYWVVPV